jgi:acetyl-CoA carboxylase biotin carboxyl carrier protein
MLKNKIKSLISIIENTEIEEIEVSSFWGAQKIRLSKSRKVSESPSASVEYISEQPKPEKNEQPAKSEKIDFSDSNVEKNIEEKSDKVSNEVTVGLNLHEVKAPLVGTYYSSPKPSAPTFVNVGDKINKGDTICIIEAMKIFNEIESDVSGIVKEICLENGNPVEFDQGIIKVSID